MSPFKYFIVLRDGFYAKRATLKSQHLSARLPPEPLKSLWICLPGSLLMCSCRLPIRPLYSLSCCEIKGKVETTRKGQRVRTVTWSLLVEPGGFLCGMQVKKKPSPHMAGSGSKDVLAMVFPLIQWRVLSPHDELSVLLVTCMARYCMCGKLPGSIQPPCSWLPSLQQPELYMCTRE